jgi:hypothetical protein
MSPSGMGKVVRTKTMEPSRQLRIVKNPENEQITQLQ